MEIAIDISPTKNEHSLRGTGSYTKLLVEALQKYEAKHTYYLFTRGQKIPENVDIAHYPYFDPFFLTLPIRKPKPVVVTVHDLIPIVYPQHFPRGFRGEIKWQIQRWSLAQAKKIITDSKASKVDIHRHVNISRDKIQVVYLAPADIFRPIKDFILLQKVSTKYHLPKRFVLYVGDINWNKNLFGLLKAIEELKALKIVLVLVGKSFLSANLSESDELNKLIHNLNIENQIMKLGFVSEADLVALYNLASVYVQPSFAEGFGLPVLEAMACGCPVVTSSASSLKEIAGPSLVIDAMKTHQIALGIKKALEINRQEWARKASAWVNKFSWKRVAAQTVVVYEEVIRA